MGILDFHAHIYPETICEKAVHSVSAFYGIDVERAGTSASLLTAGKAAGVDHFVVQSVAVTPKQVQSINTFIAGECAAHPEFYGFGTLHADMENPREEIERIEQLGLRGVKIHPDTQQFNMDDPKMLAIYEMLEGRLPVLMHCGDYRYDYSHPRRLAAVLDQFPKLTVIGAHFGGWSLFDLALEYLQERHCYLDISSSMMFLGLRRTAELIRRYGADRILFGTDFPMWNPKEELEQVYRLGLTNEELEKILCTNGMRILEAAVVK